MATPDLEPALAPGVLIDGAIRNGVLSALAPETLNQLLRDGMRVDIPAGSVLYREGDGPRCGLLDTGLARQCFAWNPDGRHTVIHRRRSLSQVVACSRGRAN